MNEFLKERKHLIPQIQHHLRMPLQADAEGMVFDFHGLYNPVIGSCGYYQTLAQTADALVVVTVGPDAVSKQLMELCAGSDSYLVADFAVDIFHHMKGGSPPFRLLSW